jgi:hypothetical protein
MRLIAVHPSWNLIMMPASPPGQLPRLPENIRLLYQHTRWRYAVHCERDNTELQWDDFTEDDVTDEMIRAGADHLLTFDPENGITETVYKIGQLAEEAENRKDEFYFRLRLEGAGHLFEMRPVLAYRVG